MYFPIVDILGRAFKHLKAVYFPVSDESKTSRVLIAMTYLFLLIAIGLGVGWLVRLWLGDNFIAVLLIGCACIAYSLYSIKKIKTDDKLSINYARWLDGAGKWYNFLGFGLKE